MLSQSLGFAAAIGVVRPGHRLHANGIAPGALRLLQANPDDNLLAADRNIGEILDLRKPRRGRQLAIPASWTLLRGIDDIGADDQPPIVFRHLVDAKSWKRLPSGRCIC